MKNQRRSRRSFLKKAALGTVGATLGGGLAERIFDLWVVKADHGQSVLDLHEMLTLGAIAGQIIPTDGTPGAREAGVVDYIDTSLKDTGRLDFGYPCPGCADRKPPDLSVRQSAYHAGLREVDGTAQKAFGQPFASLTAGQQQVVLKRLEKSEFFAQVREDTIEAFCHSKVGQRVVGYPGMTQPHGFHDGVHDPSFPPTPKRRPVRR